MLRATLIITTVLTLGACASVQNESYSTINIDGRDYQLRSRTLNGPQGTFENYAIRANDGSFRSCDPDTPRSCRLALNTSRDRDN